MKHVISAFPACGKSTISNHAEQYGLKRALLKFNEETQTHDITVPEGPGIPVFDSDSSLFDKSAFPQNYVTHIQSVLARFDDVVIFVSSHEEVRKALHDAGVDFTLVYPQRELKEEYIQRYISRGSSEDFVAMMQARWNDFIDSCETDSTPRKIILEEGEFLSDALGGVTEGGDAKPQPGGEIDYEARLQRLVARRSGESDITAAIVSVNAEAGDNDVPDTVEANSPEPALLNEPETGETALSHSDLIEAKFDMQNDIAVLEDVISAQSNADPDAGGMEQFADNSPLLQAAATDIQQRYGVDVPATISGMEGFLESLKNGLAGLLGKKKGEPSKQQVAQIKKYIYEAEKAFALYGSDKWQGEQKFINVGKVKLQVPAVLESINSASDLGAILTLINKRVINSSDKYFKNDEQRVRSAVKIFNAFKGKSPETPVSEVDAHLPIKPELLKGGVADSGIDEINVKLTTRELPVLNKDAIKDVMKAVDIIVDTSFFFIKREEEYLDIMIPEDDFYKSKFWDHYESAAQTKTVWGAGTVYGDTPEFDKISSAYSDKMLVIGKFLEQWVLASVK